MKQKYIYKLLLLLSLNIYSQTNIIYKIDENMTAGNNLQASIDNITTCQTSATLQLYASGYSGNWTNGDYSYYINGQFIASGNGGTTVDISSYIPISSFRLVKTNYNNWNHIDALLTIVSPSTFVPQLPIAQDIYYNLNDQAMPLQASITGNGRTLKWYSTSEGQRYSSTPPTPTTNQLGTQSFWVSQINADGCESQRKQINVYVQNSIPANCLSFDGINDYIKIPQPFTSSFTIEYMIKTTATASNGTQWYNGTSIVDAEVSGVTTDFGTSILGSKLAFGIGGNDTTIISASNINDGTWKHVAVTWQQNTGLMKMYINGVLERQGYGSTSARTASQFIYVGTNTYQGNYSKFNIDELRIWNKVLTLEEINQNKNCEVESTREGLKAHYKFNQGFDTSNNTTITTLTDATSNANHGTLINFTLNGTTSNWLSGSNITTGISCSTLSQNEVSYSSLKIYPNPTNGTINISSPEEISISMYDTLGKQILKQNISLGKTNINIQNMNTGIYLIQATNKKGETKNYKVVKQ